VITAATKILSIEPECSASEFLDKFFFLVKQNSVVLHQDEFDLWQLNLKQTKPPNKHSHPSKKKPKTHHH